MELPHEMQKKIDEERQARRLEEAMERQRRAMELCLDAGQLQRQLFCWQSGPKLQMAGGNRKERRATRARERAERKRSRI